MSTRLKETIINVASYYGRTISAPVLAMYAEDLADLPEDEVISAYTAYRRNPKNTQFPLPAQIRGVVSPEVDPESAAREIASRINHAVVKFGWPNAGAAEAYIGQVGWDIVNRSGGWSYICQNHGLSLDPGVFSAQVRELAKSSLTHSPEKMAEVLRLPTAQSLALMPQLNPVPEVKPRDRLLEAYRRLIASSDPHDLLQAAEIAKAIRILDEGQS